MRGSKWLALVIALAFVSTGVAVAGPRSSETLPVQGDFHAVAKRPKQRQCDKNHVRIRATFRGRQTSNDRRLEGRIEINVESVVNTANGWGRTSGSVVVRRSRHGRVKFRGEFVGVIEPDNGAEGFLTGRTFGRHGSVRLFANFNVDQNADGSITGEFGKDSQVQGPYYAPPEDQDPAVVTDACFKHGDHD
jgi:hypothetical protein